MVVLIMNKGGSVLKVTMRLYKQHDLDLLCLYKSSNFFIQKSIKQVISKYVKSGCVNDGSYKVDVSQIVFNNNSPRSAQIHIYLSDEEDAEVVEWIKNTSKGYRNSLLKNVYRNFLSEPIIFPYQSDGNNIKTSVSTNNKINVKEMVDDILNSPLSRPGDNITLTEANTVLNKHNDNIIEEKSKNEIKKENSNVQNEIKVEQDNNCEQDSEFNVFDEFENMMKNF